VDTVDGMRAPFRALQHCERLQRSCDGVQLTNPYTTEQWLDLLEEIIDRHPWPRQAVYVQVTRAWPSVTTRFPPACRRPCS